MEAVQKNLLATQPIGKLLAKFAIPGIIALLVNSLYNIVDQIFIGHGVGYLGNGATNVVFPIAVVALAFALLVGDGAAAYLSLKLGQGRLDDARKGVGNAVVIMAVAGITLMVFFQVLFTPLAIMFGATDLLLPYATDYGRIIVLGLPLVVVGAGVNSIIRADSSPGYAMKSMLVGAVINTVLDPIFIFVFDMGVQGAAIATVIGQAATFFMAVRYLFRFKSVKLNKNAFKLKRRNSARVMMLGVSSFINQMAIMVVMVIINRLLVSYGAESVYGAEIPITVLGIVMKIAAILTGILVGIAVGAQPILGFNYGAQNFSRVRETYKLTITISVAISCVCLVIFFCFPQTLIGVFGSENALYNEFAVKTFRIFLLLTPSYGFLLPSGIFLQAIGKPILATIASLTRQVLFFIPTVLVLPAFMGLDGVLWSAPVADALSLVTVLLIMIYVMSRLDGKKRTLKIMPPLITAQPQPVTVRHK